MKSKIPTIKFAFKKSLPVMVGYLFLGAAAGMLMVQAGYNALWTFFCSAFIFAGSGQFLLASLLGAGASAPSAFIMSFILNSRHIFYGLSFVDRLSGVSWRKKWYIIFATTDETYSVLCSTEFPPYVDEIEGSFFISLFDHLYWIVGTTAGAAVCQFLPVDLKGIEFSMTALFTVIVVDQWRKTNCRIPALIGVASAVACLVLLGPERFILPSLAISASLLAAAKRPIEARLARGDDDAAGGGAFSAPAGDELATVDELTAGGELAAEGELTAGGELAAMDELAVGAELAANDEHSAGDGLAGGGERE